MAIYKPTRPVSFSAGQEVGNSLFNTKTWFTILFLFFFFPFFFLFFFLFFFYCCQDLLLLLCFMNLLLWSCFLSLTFLTPPRVNSTYFFLQCHLRITLTHEGHEKKRKWSPTEEALNCWMNSPCQYRSKFLENGVENMHADVRVWRVRKNVSTELLHNFWGGV